MECLPFSGRQEKGGITRAWASQTHPPGILRSRLRSLEARHADAVRPLELHHHAVLDHNGYLTVLEALQRLLEALHGAGGAYGLRARGTGQRFTSIDGHGLTSGGMS